MNNTLHKTPKKIMKIEKGGIENQALEITNKGSLNDRDPGKAG